MQKAKELSEVLNKVQPLQKLQKERKDALLAQLLKNDKKNQKVEFGGRCYTVKQSSSKPGLSRKLLVQIINKYNEGHDTLPGDLMDFINYETEALRKKKKPRLSITGTE